MHSEAPSPIAALGSAVNHARELLTGAGAWSRWRTLWLHASLAGIVGVGVQPPPLGLLEPVWSEPEARADLLRDLTAHAPLLLVLSLVLLGALATVRGFLLAFVTDVVKGGAESAARSSGHLVGGVRHFIWSSAWTLPLYFVLFAAEWLTAARGYQKLLIAPDQELLPVILAVLAQFLVILVPWVFLTLPAMCLMYELTPVGMILWSQPPSAAASRVLRGLARRPRAALGYFSLRLLIQCLGSAVGGLAASVAAILGGAVAAPASLAAASPLLAAGPEWQRTACQWSGAALGGAVFYVVTCLLLVPLSTVQFSFADQFCRQIDGWNSSP